VGGDATVAAPTTSSSSVTTPEGVYSGTTNSGLTFNTIFLEDGSFWAIYGTQTAGKLFVSGFVQGNGTSGNGTFSATNAKDFGNRAPISGSVAATYVAGTSINGTFASTAQSASFSGTTIPVADFNYNQAANLSSIVGNWSVQGLSGASGSISIANSGAFTAASGSCITTGTIAPRPSGKNVFNVTATIGSAPCANPGLSFTGIAVSYLINGGPTRQLTIAGVDSARSLGTVVFGSR
jgi:hypothetical protein